MRGWGGMSEIITTVDMSITPITDTELVRTRSECSLQSLSDAVLLTTTTSSFPWMTWTWERVLRWKIVGSRSLHQFQVDTCNELGTSCCILQYYSSVDTRMNVSHRVE